MVKAFSDDMEKAIHDKSYKSRVLAGVAFLNILPSGSLPSDVQYALRFPSSPRSAGKQHFNVNPFKTDSRWFTEYSFPLFQQLGPREQGMDGGIPGKLSDNVKLLL